MADVAARAGVSVKTVSRVVNGEEYVTTATIERVNDAVRSLGFRANLAASTLARGSGTGTVGLVIGDVADPFYARLARGVEQVAVAQRHVVLVSSSAEDVERERDIIASLADRHVAGVVAVPSSARQDWLAAEQSRGLQVVFVDRPGEAGAADCVLTDNVAGAAAGVSHLLAAGCRRVAFVGNAGVYTSDRRLQGYRDAHASAGLPVEESRVVLGPRSVDAAEQAVRELLDRPDPPDGVFGQNDLMSIGAWRAVHAAGAAARIVGFDDFELADVLDPPVTVVQQDTEELGRRAARMLFERMSGAYDGPARTELVPTRLIVR